MGKKISNFYFWQNHLAFLLRPLYFCVLFRCSLPTLNWASFEFSLSSHVLKGEYYFPCLLVELRIMNSLIRRTAVFLFPAALTEVRAVMQKYEECWICWTFHLLLTSWASLLKSLFELLLVSLFLNDQVLQKIEI